MDRRDIGSWLEGPGAGALGADQAAVPGLPREGPGSPAGVGARFVALLIDWAASLLVTSLFVPWSDPRHALVTLAVFAVQALVGVVLGGGSFGQRLRRLRVRRVDGDVPPDLPRALLRTVLLVLVLPALVTGRDGRGGHDRAAGTVVVRA
ncbi:MAG: RDD family protein [Actinomycetota bacterium]|nr:RDD family protein [Actinomycetota bacterium]